MSNNLRNALQVGFFLCLFAMWEGDRPRSLLAANQPSFAKVQAEVSGYFSELEDWQPGDIITQQDVAPLLQRLKKLGCKSLPEKEISKLLASEGDAFVRHLRSDAGTRFMRKVSGEKLVYDRLERIAKESGGDALIRDLVKLPDGYRYAKADPGRGVPEMIEFLPKGRSGKSRQVKDYDKPTGRIYTVKDLLGELRRRHAGQ